MLPLFFTIGIIFAPIGGLLLYASSQVQEIRIDYTDCNDAPLTTNSPPEGSDFETMPENLISSAFKSSGTIQAQWARKDIVEIYQGKEYEDAIRCFLRFDIPESMGPPVLLYYHLTNFYQNHRRYVASFSEKQLKGEALDASTIDNSGCTPLTTDENGRPYYPCGLIANSMFNDTINSPLKVQSNETYEMQNNSNIAWESDKELYGKTKYSPDEVWPPQNWEARYPNGYTDDDFPDLSNDEAFMVWMRTAGLPEFSKLSRRNDNEAMTQGQYEIEIISSK